VSLRCIDIEVSEVVAKCISDVVGSLIQTDESVVFIKDFFWLNFVCESFNEVVFGFVEDRVSRSLQKFLVSQKCKPDGFEEFSFLGWSESSDSHPSGCLFSECVYLFIVLPLDFAFVVKSIEFFLFLGFFFFFWIWRRLLTSSFDCSSFCFLLFFSFVWLDVCSVSDVLFNSLEHSGFVVNVEFVVFH